LNIHPTRDVQPRKFYIPPFFTKLRPGQDSPPSLREKVRSSLKHLDNILRLDPDDTEAAQLQVALRHMLHELEAKQPAAAG
jgi:hypothetical protein